MTERIKVISSHLRNGETTAQPTSGLQQLPVGDYVYSHKEGILTPEQKRSYEENGYLVVKGLVPKDKIAIYRDRFQRICDGEVYVPGMTVMKDVAIAKTHTNEKGQKVITKIQDYQNDEVLFDYCTLPEVTQYVKSFIGPNCMAMHTMLINKPPDPGTKTSRHPMHQDLHYFPFRPANKIVCAWTAMEKVHRENGCLVVVPGTHRGDLLEHGYPDWEGGVNYGYHGVKTYNPSMDRIWVEMEEGDTVFFHPILLHGSGTNRTKGYRKAISCHYAASDCEYIDVKGTSQEVIAEEVQAIARRKLGKDLADQLDYRDIWKYRARLVCGEEDTL